MKVQPRTDRSDARLPWRLKNAPVGLVAILAIASLGAALICYAYWPGIMIDDARWQYQQAVDNAYEDWHPPIMAWVWRQLIALSPGPAPMLTLQVLLYWIGFVLIASAAYRRGHSRLALALAATGFLPAPLALMGSVTKDALMAGALLMATGMLLWRPLVRSALARAALSGGVMAALFFAAALRFNAFFACIPLALVALPDRLTCTKPRMLLSAVAAAGAFLMTAPVIAGLLHAEDTDVQLSLIIFDIGGITEHTGLSQFPDMHVPNAVAVNHRCYDPYGWDSYSEWATKLCPLGFDAVQARIDDDDLNPGNLWIRAIAAHPLAYLDHRLAHFNLSTWFIVPRGPDFTAWSQSVPNPWNFRIRESGLLTAISALANGAAVTPLGWPIFWISVALAAIVGGTIAGLPREPIAIALSGFLYGCGYFVVGVATGIRYYMWTFSGAAVAAILVGAELWRRRAMLKRRAVLVCAGIVVAPTTMAIAARVVLG